jgi:uncharacterized protein (TIGR03118 family)
MRSLFRFSPSAPARRHHRSALRRAQLSVELLETRCLLSAYLQTNLVSDIPGMAPTIDSNLKNPWGIAYSPTGPFWISDNNGNVSTIYNQFGVAAPLVVNIPAPGSPTGGTPTGDVFNPSSNFQVTENGVSGPSVFLFATEDGIIAGWAPSVDFTNAVTAVDNSANPTPDNGAVYKGLAIDNHANRIYVTNFRAGTVDVFDGNFNQIVVPGAFQDNQIPTGFAPFNIQNLGGKLYVTYALQKPDKHDDQEGPGNGFVDVYNTDGVLLKRLVQHGVLNSPWGLALAPVHGFGQFGGDLLVGNFGDGTINVFDPNSGANLGTLTDASGNQIQIDDLWGLKFGNRDDNFNSLFFTAGINDEQDGLFGRINVIHPLLTALSDPPPLNPSTVPANGDLNPYGVAFVPQGFRKGGPLNPGDILVSNFNDFTNTQGTGTTIVRIAPDGTQSLFFQGDPNVLGPLGLTTALGVLQRGYVIVGSVPTDANGNAQQGSLLILDRFGNVLETLSDPNLLDGPWDLTVNDNGATAQVFVSNVLSGTVTRIDLDVPFQGMPTVRHMTQIASGYFTRTDPAALVVGPTGVAFIPGRNTLFVASTGDNEIFAISDAGTRTTDAGMGTLIYSDPAHLRGPLGLVFDPRNGDFITTNGDAVNPDPNGVEVSELVEFTPLGQFVVERPIDDLQSPGGAFGIALENNQNGSQVFAAVDDDTNTLEVWSLHPGQFDNPKAASAKASAIDFAFLGGFEAGKDSPQGSFGMTPDSSHHAGASLLGLPPTKSEHANAAILLSGAGRNKRVLDWLFAGLEGS